VGPDRNGTLSGAIPVLYLLTDEISSVLVRGQLSHLIGEGFDVTVAARRSDPGEPPEPGKWDDGVTVEHLPFVREPSPIADLRALWATIRLIRRLKPAIVNASTPKAGLLGMLAAWLCRVPVRVYVVRGFRFETATGWRRRLFRSLEWVAIRCANHVVFNSRSLLGVGEREGLITPGRGEVIGGGSGNGVNVSRFADDVLPTRGEARERFGLPAEATVVGFVGRFTRDKGIADLTQVFTSTLRQRPDVWLLLVGEFEDGDPVPADVRATIEHDERIVTVPWLDHPGVAYRAMDLLVFPSYREGLPNVPLEAQLCGVPVVGYAATGTVDAVAPGSALVTVGDVDALSGEIVAQVDAGIGRSSSERQEATWVVENFERARLWSGLVDRYRAWVLAS
jgi:glycosyltransferase involved in cell wall biosynthesis